MKKGYILPVVALMVLASGCGKKKQKNKLPKQQEMSTNVDIPMAEDGIKSFFDEDISEFALVDDATRSGDVTSINTNIDSANLQNTEYAWVDEQVDSDNGFKKVYFDFDKYNVREDQRTNLDHDIELAKKMIEESKFLGKEAPVVVIDGHACHSAGTRAYNLALSEKRAKVLADKFIEAGVAPELIKIVGRGSEMPALVDGRTCEGSREQQWPNRRDELHIIYS